MKTRKIYNLLIPIIISSFFLMPVKAANTEQDTRYSLPYLETSEILKLINTERELHQLAPLKSNKILTEAAMNKTNSMEVEQYFAHYSPQNKGLKDLMKEVDYIYMYAGENLAINYSDNEELVRAWLNSESHRYNILFSEYEEIGIYFKKINLNGINQIVAVTIFGKNLIIE